MGGRVKLYRVVEFYPSLGRILLVSNTIYKSEPQAKAMRTRYIRRMEYQRSQLVFIEETETEWTKVG